MYADDDSRENDDYAENLLVLDDDSSASSEPQECGHPEFVMEDGEFICETCGELW